jgi:signal transduction histidine kinase
MSKDLIRILHLEDDEEDFIIIRDLLGDTNRHQYKIDWVSGYEEALERVKSDGYDIYLVDYMLGKYNGLQLLKHIRETHEHTPVIIFTGQGDDRIDIEAMKAGAADYLVKGQIDANILERSIRYSINQAKTLQMLIENEQSLRSAEKFAVTGRVAQLVAHEVRNPLTNIKLALQQLQEDIPDPDELHKPLFDLVDRNCNRINQLIIDLLDSTKFTELKFEDISINQLMDETIEMARDRIELKRIQIIKQYATDICDVFVDTEKIKIALLNIIINAIEEVEVGTGAITFRTEARENKCIAIIRDNGKGIKPDHFNRIFEPFYTGKQKGTGLGLTTTQNIILNHQGSIKVESQPLQGTSFIIAFDFSPNKNQ